MLFGASPQSIDNLERNDKHLKLNLKKSNVLNKKMSLPSKLVPTSVAFVLTPRDYVSLPAAAAFLDAIWLRTFLQKGSKSYGFMGWTRPYDTACV